jgi:hypothetical protein
MDEMRSVDDRALAHVVEAAHDKFKTQFQLRHDWEFADA